MEKLRELLCEIPEIREDLSDETHTFDGTDGDGCPIYRMVEADVEERHIRWYCEEKGINPAFMFEFKKTDSPIQKMDKGEFRVDATYKLVTTLDNKIPLSEQPKAMEKIYEFLKKQK